MSDKAKANSKTYLKDYLPPAFLVDEVALQFDLDETETRVMSRFSFRFNEAFADASGASLSDTELFLDGEQLELVELYLNGEKQLEGDHYRLTETSLAILTPPEKGEIICLTVINPKANTSLEGLYRSGPMYCTQCEADGFRRITYFPDRPDVMSRYTTKIIADKALNPVLLSNGNPVDRGSLGNGKHWVEWQDPHPKPSYLFALVAGDLHQISDSFTTCSGRDVTIHFYVEPENADKCDHAVESLKNSMAWDEQAYGREYDLDIYMVVAVSHFNMGAMENKGLNVFNSKFVLASPETATDEDYDGIEAVIGHEYFHNWSGNRVTCRDWFQLSLKEGFTVLREQQFSAAMGSEAVNRIGDVRRLRSMQFPEDAGPTAHPVRPELYIETNNLYTATVYEKGAEVVRMLLTLEGPEVFRKGCDLYFDRHDGQAVCTEDFVAAHSEVSGNDYTHFSQWYSQAGTPKLDCEWRYEPDQQRYCLSIAQTTAPTPGQKEKSPLYIPIKMGLIDGEGQPQRIRINGVDLGQETCISVAEERQNYYFEALPEGVVPSLLRGFSAPVDLNLPLSTAELALLFAFDADGYVRWDAGQRLAAQAFELLCEDPHSELSPIFVSAIQQLLVSAHQTDADLSLIAECLSFPNTRYWVDTLDSVDIEVVVAANKALTKKLAVALSADWESLYQLATGQDNKGARHAAAVALKYMLAANAGIEDSNEVGLNAAAELAVEQYGQANNMTDRMAAITPLVQMQYSSAAALLDDFYQRWQHELLVVDKWLALQAAVPAEGTVEVVAELLEHPAFSLDNPNKLRSLVGVFAQANPVAFHREDGAGYRLVADQVLRLNEVNPQIGARLVACFNRWNKIQGSRSQLMKAQLERIIAAPSLARPIYDIVARALGYTG